MDPASSSGPGHRRPPLCKQCNRRHLKKDACPLFLRTKIAKSGARVKRWAS